MIARTLALRLLALSLLSILICCVVLCCTEANCDVEDWPDLSNLGIQYLLEPHEIMWLESLDRYLGRDRVQICTCERHCGTQDSDLHDSDMIVEKDPGKDASANADIHGKQSNLR